MPEPAVPPLILCLLGRFEARLHGVPLARLHSRKGQGLLALLALRAGREAERAWLAGLLWPDSFPPQALASLRNTLANLRRALGPEAHRLRSPTTLTLALELGGAAVDVVAFDAAMARGDPTSLEQAVALYRGPLLEGCAEEWVFQERQAREQAYLQALESLAADAIARGDPAGAERHLRRAVAVDPLRESAQRTLMQALGAGGNSAAALLAYRELRLLLHRELNAAPDPETQAVFQQVRAVARSRAQVAPAVGDRSPTVPLPPALLRLPLSEDTLTFLFTDLAGSSRLWEDHPDAMPEALARHEALLRQATEAHGGSVFKTLADSCCAAFATAQDALEAALAAQRALHTEQWGAVGELRVRMALNTGTAEEREGDYFGLALNRLARLLDTGHGGQILLSRATVELVRDQLPEGADLRDLGEHRLPGLRRPEPIFQLVVPDLPANFPPLRSLEAFRHNLPLQLTRFIGREREMAQVKDLLATDRLVTLTGAGGCGKTRLALQVAGDLVECVAGVRLVELAPLADPTLVPQAVASALGVREDPGQALTAALAAALRHREFLLVLDNCEHLVEGCARLVEVLLQACPGLRVLATSRETLGIPGESCYRVPSLSLPDLRRIPPLERLAEYESVRLFLERAEKVMPGFRLTEANAPAVAQICARLNGIPLALELAAARVKAVSVEEIAARLDDRFSLLTGGSRTAPPRHRTLRGLIDWSYDLLLDAERTLLRRLAVFSGGWSLEAAEGVCTGDGIEGGEVLDLLTALVDKSMVQYEGREGEARYRLLETLRQYSQDRLLESKETEVVRGRHRDWYLGFAEQAEPGLWGPDQVEWFNRLEGDQDNLRAALAWSQAEDGSGEEGLRLVGALWELWDHRGYWREGRGWMERALARAAALGRTAARAKALSGAGEMAWHQGDYTAGRSLLEESVAIWRELGEKRGLADALNHLGWVAGCEGSHAEQHSLQAESLAIWRELGDKWGIAESLLGLGNVAWGEGDCQAARVRYEESLMLCREAGKKRGVANALGNLANMAYSEGNFAVAHAFHEESLAIRRELGDRGGFASELHSLGDEALDQGDYGAARSHFEESLAIRKELGNRRGMAHAVRSLGRVACRQGDYGAARSLYQESLAIHRELGDKSGLARLLADFAGLAAGQRQAQRAARLLGAAEALCEAIDAGPPATSSTEDVGIKAEVCTELGEAVFAAAWAEGRAMTLEQAIAYAVRKET
jgi:predicted ATPase/DNA-binding SARP family transcriptional activator